jgi:hypothetical protein
VEVIAAITMPSGVRHVNLVAATVALGERLREPGDRVERLVDVARLVKDPGQVQRLVLDRDFRVPDLLQVRDLRVEDVLARDGRLDPHALVGQDAVIHISRWR